MKYFDLESASIDDNIVKKFVSKTFLLSHLLFLLLYDYPEIKQEIIAKYENS